MDNLYPKEPPKNLVNGNNGTDFPEMNTPQMDDNNIQHESRTPSPIYANDGTILLTFPSRSKQNNHNNHQSNSSNLPQYNTSHQLNQQHFYPQMQNNVNQNINTYSNNNTYIINDVNESLSFEQNSSLQNEINESKLHENNPYISHSQHDQFFGDEIYNQQNNSNLSYNNIPSSSKTNDNNLLSSGNNFLIQENLDIIGQNNVNIDQDKISDKDLFNDIPDHPDFCEENDNISHSMNNLHMYNNNPFDEINPPEPDIIKPRNKDKNKSKTMYQMPETCNMQNLSYDIEQNQNNVLPQDNNDFGNNINQAVIIPNDSFNTSSNYDSDNLNDSIVSTHNNYNNQITEKDIHIRQVLNNKQKIIPQNNSILQQESAPQYSFQQPEQQNTESSQYYINNQNNIVDSFQNTQKNIQYPQEQHYLQKNHENFEKINNLSINQISNTENNFFQQQNLQQTNLNNVTQQYSNYVDRNNLHPEQQSNFNPINSRSLYVEINKQIQQQNLSIIRQNDQDKNFGYPTSNQFNDNNSIPNVMEKTCDRRNSIPNSRQRIDNQQNCMHNEFLGSQDRQASLPNLATGINTQQNSSSNDTKRVNNQQNSVLNEMLGINKRQNSLPNMMQRMFYKQNYIYNKTIGIQNQQNLLSNETSQIQNRRNSSPNLLLEVQKQQISQPNMIQKASNQQIPKSNMVQRVNNQQIPQSNMVQRVNNQQILQSNMVQGVNNQQFSQPNMVQRIHNQQITQQNMIQRVNNQQVPQPNMIQRTNNQQISQPNMVQGIHNQQVLPPNMVQRIHNHPIPQPNMLQSNNNQKTSVLNELLGSHSKQTSIVNESLSVYNQKNSYQINPKQNMYSNNTKYLEQSHVPSQQMNLQNFSNQKNINPSNYLITNQQNQKRNDIFNHHNTSSNIYQNSQQYYNRNDLNNYPQGQMLNNNDNSEQQLKNKINTNLQYNYKQSSNYSQQNLELVNSQKIGGINNQLYPSNNQTQSVNSNPYEYPLTRNEANMVNFSMEQRNIPLNTMNHIMNSSSINIQQNKIIENSNNSTVNNSFMTNMKTYNIVQVNYNNIINHPTSDQSKYLQNSTNLNNFPPIYRGEMPMIPHGSNIQNNQQILNNKSNDLLELNYNSINTRNIPEVSLVPEIDPPVRKKRQYTRRNPTNKNKINDETKNSEVNKTIISTGIGNINLQKEMNINETKIPKRRGRKPKVLKELEARMQAEARIQAEKQMTTTVTTNTINITANNINYNNVNIPVTHVEIPEVENLPNNEINRKQNMAHIISPVVNTFQNNVVQSNIENNTYFYTENQEQLSVNIDKSTSEQEYINNTIHSDFELIKEKKTSIITGGQDQSTVVIPAQQTVKDHMLLQTFNNEPQNIIINSNVSSTSHETFINTSYITSNINKNIDCYTEADNIIDKTISQFEKNQINEIYYSEYIDENIQINENNVEEITNTNININNINNENLTNIINESLILPTNSSIAGSSKDSNNQDLINTSEYINYKNVDRSKEISNYFASNTKENPNIYNFNNDMANSESLANQKNIYIQHSKLMKTGDLNCRKYSETNNSMSIESTTVYDFFKFNDYPQNNTLDNITNEEENFRDLNSLNIQQNIEENYNCESNYIENIDDLSNDNILEDNINNLEESFSKNETRLNLIEFTYQLIDKINVTIQIEATMDNIIHGIYVCFPNDLDNIKLKNKPNMYTLLSILIREILIDLEISNSGIILFNFNSFLQPYFNENIYEEAINDNEQHLIHTNVHFWNFDNIYKGKKLLPSYEDYGILLNVEENENQFYLTFSRYPINKNSNSDSNLKDCLKNCLLENGHQLRPHYFDSIYYDIIIGAIRNFFQNEIIEYLILCNEEGNLEEKMVHRYVNDSYNSGILGQSYLDILNKQQIPDFLVNENIDMGKNIEIYKNFKYCGLFDSINNVPSIVDFRISGNFRQYCRNICDTKLFNISLFKDNAQFNSKNFIIKMNKENNISQLLLRNNLSSTQKINIFEQLLRKNYSPNYINMLLWNLDNMNNLPNVNQLLNNNNLIINQDNFVDQEEIINLYDINELHEEDVTALIEINEPTEKIENIKKTIDIITTETCTSSFRSLDLRFKKKKKKSHRYFTWKLPNKCSQELTIYNKEVKKIKNNNLTVKPYTVRKSFVNEKDILNISNNDFNINKESNSLSISHVEKIKHYYNMDNLNIIDSNIELNNNLSDATFSSTQLARINDEYNNLSFIEVNFALHKKLDSLECSIIVPELCQVIKTSTTIHNEKISLSKEEEIINVHGVGKDVSYCKTQLDINNKQIILSKSQEEFSVLHTKKIANQHDACSLYTVQSNTELKNNLTDASISCTEIVKCSYAQEQFSFIEQNFTAYKEPEIISCFETIPETSYVIKTAGTFNDNEINLFREEANVEASKIISDKVCEKTVLNTNNSNITLLKESQKVKVLHTEEIRKQQMKDSFNIVETNVTLNNNLTEANISSTEKCRVNDDKEEFSITETNFEYNRIYDSEECSSVIPEISYVVKTSANICQKEVNLHKDEAFYKVSLIASDKVCEKAILNTNNSNITLLKESQKMKVLHTEEIRKQQMKDSLNIIETNVNLNNNLTQASISSVEKCRINDNKDEFSITETNFESNRKYDSEECFSVIPEISYVVKTSANICQKEINLHKDESSSEICVIAKDKAFEKINFNLNKSCIELVKPTNNVMTSHIEKISNICVGNSLNIKKSNYSLVKKPENLSTDISIKIPNFYSSLYYLKNYNLALHKNPCISGATCQLKISNGPVKQSFSEITTKFSFIRNEESCSIVCVLKDKVNEKLEITISENVINDLPDDDINLSLLNNGDLCSEYHYSGVDETFEIDETEELDTLYIYENPKSCKRRRIVPQVEDIFKTTNEIITSTLTLNEKYLKKEDYQCFGYFIKSFITFLNEYSVIKTISDEIKNVKRNDKKEIAKLLREIILKIQKLFPKLFKNTTIKAMKFMFYKIVKIWVSLVCSNELNDPLQNKLFEFIKNNYESNLLELYCELSDIYEFNGENIAFKVHISNNKTTEKKLNRFVKIFNKLICNEKFQYFIVLSIENENVSSTTHEIQMNNDTIDIINTNDTNETIETIEPIEPNEPNEPREANEPNESNEEATAESSIVEETNKEKVDLSEIVIIGKVEVLYDTLFSVKGIERDQSATICFLTELAKKYIGELGMNYVKMIEDIIDKEKNGQHQNIYSKCLKTKYVSTKTYFILFSVNKKQFLQYCRKIKGKKSVLQKYINTLIECGTICDKNNIDENISNNVNIEDDNSFSKIHLTKYLLEGVRGVNEERVDYLRIKLIRTEKKKCKIIIEILNSCEIVEQFLPDKPKEPSKRGRKLGSKNVRKRRIVNSLFLDLFGRFETVVKIEMSKRSLEHSGRFANEIAAKAVVMQAFSFDKSMERLYRGICLDKFSSRILAKIAQFNPLLYICSTGISVEELELFKDYNPLLCRMIEVDLSKCTYQSPNKEALYYHILQFHFKHIKKCTWKGCQINPYFKAISNFAEHAASHIKYKRFQCIICQAGYSRHADLKIHIHRNHSARYRIKCCLKRCNHYFTTVEASLKHLYTYHFPVKQWICPVYGCGRSFFDKGSANQHIKTNHCRRTRRISSLLEHCEYKNTYFGVITHSLLDHFYSKYDEEDNALFTQRHLNSYHCRDVCVHIKEKPLEVSKLAKCVLKKDLHKIAKFGYETFLEQLKKHDCFAYIIAVEDMKLRRQYELLPILNQALNIYIDSDEQELQKNDIEVYEQMVIELNKPDCLLKIITLESNQRRFEIPEQIPKDVPELLKDFILNKSYICPNYLKRVQDAYISFVKKNENNPEPMQFKNTVPRYVDYKIPVEVSNVLRIDDSLELIKDKEILTNEDKTELERQFWKRLLEGSLSITSLSYFKKGFLSLSDEAIETTKTLYSTACSKFIAEIKQNSGFSEEAEEFFLEQFKRIERECAPIEREATMYANFKNVLKEIDETITEDNVCINKVAFSRNKIFPELDFLSSFETFKEVTSNMVSIDLEMPPNKRRVKKNVCEGEGFLIEDFKIDDVDTSNIVEYDSDSDSDTTSDNGEENKDKEGEKSMNTHIIDDSIFNIDLPSNIDIDESDNDKDIYDESGVYSHLGYNVQLMIRAKMSGIYGVHISEEKNSLFQKKALKHMVGPFCCNDIIMPEQYKYETYDNKGRLAYIEKQKRIELVDTSVSIPILNDLIILSDEVAKKLNQTNVCLKAHVSPNDRRKVKLRNKEGLVIIVELNQLDYFRCRVVDPIDNTLFKMTRNGIKTMTTVKPKITAMYGVQNWEVIGGNEE
ncbi:Zinc finger protein GLIS2 [Strongyloides ratti]|uniref:Zinc finger protein GLIS2 n=1 Tax=Strongyloides ratti TaxID=34506 RepID=A0A090LU10_STRRB|nr:Zinc finger protein GLIS2 [Strongyloides ratti]CEF71124.1 Zinc finger protein GLIS2 [Strongyloides ratti]